MIVGSQELIALTLALPGGTQPGCRRDNRGRFCRIDCKHCFHYPAGMVATVYNRGQMVIPVQARQQAGIDQGDVLNVQVEGDGRLLLVRLQRPKNRPPVKVKILQRRGKHPVGDIGRTITRQEIKAALAEFP